ncbi:hypothetical protein EW146_g9405 [Bondarzewia mesenterica]|uniref:Uncharacterized protein n=1 Tax=Bondarzewia mesenterica TaxID=1095465 RepID=A0A4S4L6W0_9AGAM|nr:hypothetical protein EW146_g9405 [Bondarzewia mesenterica]
MSRFSSVGKVVFMVYAGHHVYGVLRRPVLLVFDLDSAGAIILMNVLVLALSARVNQFQNFFFVADLFPFALSIITLSISVLMLLLDVGVEDSITAHPPFQIGMLFLLSIFWLAFNSFSTSRWTYIPLNCSSIPPGALVALRYAMTQSQRGQKHIWSTPLSRYRPQVSHWRTPTPYTFEGGMGSHMSQMSGDVFAAR